MKRAWLWLLVCAGCGGGGDDGPTGIGPEGGTVTSADGILELTIPAGAVSEETAFAITLVPESEWPGEFPPAEIVGNVYDLQPEGTTFGVPARLTWTYATAPTNATGPDGHKVLFESSVSEAGVVETAAQTEIEVRTDGSLVATTEITHLSKHLVTGTVTNGEQVIESSLGFVSAELRGGTHFVELPWTAASILFTSTVGPGIGIGDHVLEAEPRADGIVVPLNDPTDWNNPLLFFELGYQAEIPAGEADAPATMPRWKCTATGTANVRLGYAVSVFNTILATSVVGVVLFEEEVSCVVREEKPEFLEHETTLGAGRIENLAVPATAARDLSNSQGLFGYLVTVGPGQTVEVCITTTGSASVLYFPHFPPGFDFLDTAPGCTNVTNLDPDNANDVLVELAGSGGITITTRAIVPT